MGKVVAVQGEVTYTSPSDSARKPLTVGMELRAEWTVHTGRDAKISARLRNGHLWTLSSDLAKKVSTISALTLPPTKDGAYDRLTALGTRDGNDRSASAGLHQEHTAATKAAPSRPPVPGDSEKAALDEIPSKPAPKRTSKPAPVFKAEPGSKPKAKPSPQKTTRRHYRSPSRGGAAKSGGSRGAPAMGSGSTTSSLQGLLRAASRTSSPKPPSSGAANLPGRLTRTQIQAALRRLLPLLRGCMRQLKVAGLLRVHITVKGSTGRVSAVSVQGRGAADPLTRCMRSKAGAVGFAKFAAATQSFALPVKSQ